MKLRICDQNCHLLPEKAVFWEEHKTLIIADLHLGKGTVFRKAGIPIPEGIMDDDLLKLTHLLNRLNAEKCIIVGDLIHAESGLSAEVKRKFSKWLQNTPCAIHLVLGNHDRALLKNLPLEWHLQVYKEGLLIPPFYFSHFPVSHEEGFVWSGHVHPKVEVRNNYDRLVLSCFQIFKDRAILPAFGFFVGGALVKKSKECRIYAIGEDAIIAL